MRAFPTPLASLTLAVATVLAGLSGPAIAATSPTITAAASTTADAPACRQTAFRVRADFEAGLNDDTGWRAATNITATVDVDRPFRLRVEAETVDVGETLRRFWLQVRRNGGEWTDVEAADFPYPLMTPLVSVVSNDEYRPGEPTTDLLDGSGAVFRPGAGIAGQATTPSWVGGGAHGEWEWPLVIRRFGDGAHTVETGDRFEFRMVDTHGACALSATPVLTANVPAGHLGGTFVETPGPIGPWQATNGDLYFIMEPAETGNVLMMVKSEDGGRSWREVDGANRPATDDLEGFASTYTNGTVHMLHQTSDDVWLHAFRTSDHPAAPDTWAVRDEKLASPQEPPTQVAALAARSDGSLVGVYGGPEQIHFKIRSPEGVWSRETIIDATTGPRLSGPMVVTGNNDVVHLAYTGHDGTAWYRTIGTDGRLGARQQVATGLGMGESDVGSILPLVHLPERDTVVVMYRLANGQLWERRKRAGGPLEAPVRISDRLVVQGAIDSDQTGADAIGVDGEVHVLFIEQDSGSIFHARSDRGGHWQPATLQVDDVDAQWVRGQPVRRADGRRAYGFVYDAGSNGGSGMNRYGEVPIDPR